MRDLWILKRVSCGLIVGALLCVPMSAHCDAPGAFDSSGIEMQVRVVRAEGRGPTEDHQSRLSTPEIKIDREVLDLDAQLRKLNYRYFHLVSSDSYYIPVLRKMTVPLVQGNKLTVRPIYTEGEKVGLWLRWLDSSGRRILDTRLHLDGSNPVLTGAENSRGSGLILAISAKSLPKAP